MPRVLNVIAAAAFFLPMAAGYLTAQEKIDFRRDIRPILSDKCFLCHGPDSADRKAGLRLDTEEGAHEEVIVPGSLEESEFWLRVIADDPDEKMPPTDSHKELDAEEIAKLKQWIVQGAKYEEHWSFRKPVSPAVPKSQRSRFSGPIDAFVHRRMMEKGLRPSPRASRAQLIRRVTQDLTGLPPTIEEINAFVDDTHPDAYEKLVDRLLASRRFGERMAVEWMDIARYGDTSVFHADGPRDMWRWRDWVIKAYNSNMPFDQFTLKQLAGDLLPGATLEDKIATGFNRNNASTDEGGVIAEEYRVEYVVDRVKTTSMVWLGLSMECAQCHDHKYDPVSQEEYYRFYAFFNQAADPGMQTRNGNQAPLVKVPNLENEKQVPGVETRIKELRHQVSQLMAKSEPEFEAWQEKMRREVKPTPADDMVNHFALDQVDQNRFTDLADSENFAEVVGDGKLVKGRWNQALLSNNQRFAKSPKAGQNLDLDDAFSFGCWIFYQGKPSGSPIARMDDGNQHRGWDLFLYPNGTVEAHLVHDWPENTANVKGPGKLRPRQWQHLFVTYDGSRSANGLKIFVNGKRIQTKPEHDSLTKTIRTDVPFTIGRRTPGFIFNGQVDDVRIFDRQLSEREVAILAGSDPAAEILAIHSEKRTPQQKKRLQEIFLEQSSPKYNQLRKQIAENEKRLNQLRKPLTTVMVMQDVPKMRQTFVLDRGQYDSPNKKKPVSPGVPDFLPELSSTYPANRLGLAKWLVDPENPLTARVTVNRLWKVFFGKGIVQTAEDFGSQGQWPSHPQLLDWLATDFVANGWDRKRLIKQIVMSETYCQSSRRSDSSGRDPENIFLSRGPRFRLKGEFIRDQALYVSGLLNQKIGGPGVKPYQPAGLWNEVSLNGNLRFRQDHGDKLYRRSLYTYWKRSAPPPSMTIFDAPTREKCTVRRGRTNTPLQALVLMNDPQFVEASRMFAERILKQGGESTESKIAFAVQTALGREPDEKMMRILKSTLEEERRVFAKDRQRAEKLLGVGEAKRDQKLDSAELAAWTILANLLFNLDEVVTRG